MKGGRLLPPSFGGASASVDSQTLSSPWSISSKYELYYVKFLHHCQQCQHCQYCKHCQYPHHDLFLPSTFVRSQSTWSLAAFGHLTPHYQKNVNITVDYVCCAKYFHDKTPRCYLSTFSSSPLACHLVRYNIVCLKVGIAKSLQREKCQWLEPNKGSKSLTRILVCILGCQLLLAKISSTIGDLSISPKLGWISNKENAGRKEKTEVTASLSSQSN